MEDRKLNEKESLELIARMIRNTKQNLEKGNGNIFIIWGITTLFVTILVGALLYITHNQVFNWLFMLMPIIGNVWMRLLKNKQQSVYTQIDRIIGQVWMIVGLTAILVPIILYVFIIFKQELLVEPAGSIFLFVPFIEILICSIGLAITGAILEFKASKIGGIVGILLSLFMLINIPFGVISIFVIWSLVSLIIPGIKLNIYVRKNMENV